MIKTERKKHKPVECLNAIKTFHEQTGQVSSSAYSKWRLKNKNFPSIMSIYTNLGRWKDAIQTLSINKREEAEVKPVAGKQLCKKAIRIFYEQTGTINTKRYQEWQKQHPHLPTLFEINSNISWKEYKKQLTRNKRTQKKTAI